MIDAERLAELKTAIRGGESPKDPLAEMSQSELRRLRGEIDRLLPEANINGMNLETELVEQYNLVKDLQASSLHDDEIPLNQRSQLAGQVASTLQQLVKMQVDLKRDERLKKIESVFLEAIENLPEEAKDMFFDEYERIALSKGLDQ